MIPRYLLDTGIAQDFQDDRCSVRDRADAARKLGHRIGVCVPVLGELEGSASRELNLRRLRHAMSRLIVWPYSSEAAAEYGRIFAELRKMGRPMQQIDIQIGAIARTLPNCVIVSKDSDLQAIPGVTIENWAS